MLNYKFYSLTSGISVHLLCFFSSTQWAETIKIFVSLIMIAVKCFKIKYFKQPVVYISLLVLLQIDIY